MSRVRDKEAHSTLAFLNGGGEMGARIRAFDWTGTSLGPPDHWPQALRTSLRVLLTTNHPVFLFWGPEHLCFYNDAYSQSLGPEKHPAILGAGGREAWEEIWDIIGPQIEQVMRGRGATWHENHLVPITRHGRREEVYWTYSYGPIDHEAAPSGVGGVLVICTETTATVLAGRRLEFLLELERRTRDLSDARAILELATASLGRYFEAARCGYAEADAATGRFVVETEWTAGDVAHLHGERALDELAGGEADAGIHVPLTAGGRTVACLYLHPRQPRRWAAEDRQLIEDVARRTHDSVEQARAQARLRASNEALRLISDAMPMLMSFIDADERYRYVNRRYEEWFGLAAGDVLGRTMTEVLGPVARAALEPYVQRALAGHRVQFETLAPYKEGGARYIRGEYSPTRRQDGAIDGFYVFVQDISERRQAEQRLHLALQGARAGVWEWDLVTGKVSWSPETFALLGIAPDVEPDADVFVACVHPEDRARVRAQMESVVAHGGRFELELRIVRPDDGRQLWVSSVGTVDVDAAGRPLRARGMNQDITARKLAQLQLRESEARFALLANSTPVLVWQADTENRGVWFNRQWLEFTGRSMEQELGYGWLESIHPDDRPHAAEYCQAHLERRAAFEMEFRFKRHDGEYRWVLDRGSPMFDPGTSGFLGYIGSMLDITERKASEAALRESEARFRNMADHAPVMIWVTEPDGYCSYLSNKWFEFTGQTRETGLGFGWLDATHPDDREGAGRIFLEATQRREPFRLEYRLRRADGEYRWAIDSAAPRFGERGEFLGFIGSVIDITERKQMEDALRATDQRKDEFLAMLAHELRNPLAPIRTAAQVLKLSVSGEPQALRTSEIIVRQVEHMTEIVDELLDVSRVTRGLVELHLEAVDVKQAVAAAIEQCRPGLEARRQRLTLHAPDEPLHVKGDAVRLVQIIGNLLGNAVKYTPEDGAIDVELRAEEGEVTIGVRDTGMGITADLLPHVFDLFTQADRSAARSQGGLGLGLALAKRLIELHGGTITAHSGGLGLGSQFMVRLPLLAESRVRPQRSPKPVVEANGNRRLRLLVVDDNKDAADLLAALLGMEGHEVAVEHDAFAALERAVREKPPVMLLDIGLPAMDGYELAQRLRAHPETASATLIALTGYGRDSDRRRSQQAGFDHHLVKPVDPAQLSALLDSVARRAS